jgi:hypothetical protein
MVTPLNLGSQRETPNTGTGLDDFFDLPQDVTGDAFANTEPVDSGEDTSVFPKIDKDPLGAVGFALQSLSAGLLGQKDPGAQLIAQDLQQRSFQLRELSVALSFGERLGPRIANLPKDKQAEAIRNATAKLPEAVRGQFQGLLQTFVDEGSARGAAIIEYLKSDPNMSAALLKVGGNNVKFLTQLAVLKFQSDLRRRELLLKKSLSGGNSKFDRRVAEIQKAEPNLTLQQARKIAAGLVKSVTNPDRSTSFIDLTTNKPLIPGDDDKKTADAGKSSIPKNFGETKTKGTESVTGLRGAGNSILNNLKRLFGGEAFAPDAERAVKEFETTRITLIGAFRDVLGGRMLKSVQDAIDKATPSPGNVFDSRETLLLALKNASNTIKDNARVLEREANKKGLRPVTKEKRDLALGLAVSGIKKLDDLIARLEQRGSGSGGSTDLPRPKTSADVDKLPSGTEFIWTDGKKYRKN